VLAAKTVGMITMMSTPAHHNLNNQQLKRIIAAWPLGFPFQHIKT
jgi:hypothetical protein